MSFMQAMCTNNYLTIEERWSSSCERVLRNVQSGGNGGSLACIHTDFYNKMLQ